jgi:hypothetical protein
VTAKSHNPRRFDESVFMAGADSLLARFFFLGIRIEF